MKRNNGITTNIAGCPQPDRGTIASAFFSFVCPRRWEDLKETDQPTVRKCGWCRESVTLYSSIKAAETAGATGLHCCVAIVDDSLVGSPRQRPRPNPKGGGHDV